MVVLKEQHVCFKFCFRWKIQWCRKLWNVESSFWQANIEKNASFWVVFQVQKWRDLAIAETPRMSIDKKNRWKCGFSNLSSETEESPPVSGWHMGHYFGSVWSVLKENVNGHQIAAKFVLACWVSSRRGIVSWHDFQERFQRQTDLPCDMFLFPASNGVNVSPLFKQNCRMHLSRFKQCTSQAASNGVAIIGPTV